MFTEEFNLCPMKRIKKILVFGGIAVVIIIIAAIVVAGFFLGDIVKAGVNRVGPEVTQVPVTVDHVGISLMGGSVSIKDLVVGNPPGYKAPQAISLGEVTVSVNPFSVLSPKIVVHEVHVISPEITFEGNPFTEKNNLTQIRNNVDAYNGPANGQAPAAGANPAAPAKPAKKLEVDDFLISGAKVHYGSLTMPLPDIHLTDLGQGEDGITAADLTKRVLSALTTATMKAVGESATHLGQGASKEAGAGLDSLKKGIGNLFGK